MSSATLPAPTWRDGVKRDVLASIVVFLVALPLCIGIAVAVGVDPGRALITGVVGGVVVGFFAGCPLQVSGPAAGLFVIIADLLSQKKAEFLAAADASLDPAALDAQAMQYALMMLGSAVMVAGVLQFIAGQLRLGQWFRAVSPAVIEGMLAGIGVLIVASQIHVMLDHDPHYDGEKASGGLEYLATIPEAFWKCIAPSETSQHHWACATGLLTIFVILAWQRFAPQRLKLVPGSLIAVIIATIVAMTMQLEVIRLQVPENMLSEVTLPSTDTFSAILTPSVLLAGLVIAVVGSAETLLCATAVDQMQMGQRTNYDRELWAQGVGNLICGCLGALPMTGVIVRSSANVQAGAQTRLSTILHGCWLLVFVVALPWVLAMVPKAALGAILVYTGFKLVKLKELRKLWRLDKGEAVIFVVTVVVIVSQDLLAGVLTGIALSAAKLLYRFSHLSIELEIPSKETAKMRMKGIATFIRLPRLATALDKVPAGAELHVDLRDLEYIDHACFELLMNWAKQHESNGGKLVLDWASLHARFNSEGGGANGAADAPGAVNGQKKREHQAA